MPVSMKVTVIDLHCVCGDTVPIGAMINFDNLPGTVTVTRSINRPLTRKHSGRMRTAYLPTVCVLVVTTRSQNHWGKVS